MQVNDLFSILPVVVLAMFGCVMLLLRFDLSRGYVFLLTVAEVLAGVALWRQTDFAGLTGFRGAILVDSFGIYLNAICLAAALLSAIGAYQYMARNDEDEPEFYGLILLAQS
ncbi:MAG: NADH-quinone oxidoreductase subunit N, partial [Chloroflexia bacterium]